MNGVSFSVPKSFTCTLETQSVRETPSTDTAPISADPRDVFMEQVAKWANENNRQDIAKELEVAYSEEATSFYIRGDITEWPPLPPTVSILVVIKNANLQELPPLPEQVTSLELSGYQNLTSLQGNLSKLKYLKIMNCDAFNSLPNGCSGLKSVALINLPNLTTLPDDLHELTDLEIHNCRNFTQLPNTMTKLTHLDLFGCSSLEVSLQEFPEVRNLDVRQVKNVIQLPPKLKTLKADLLLNSFFVLNKTHSSQESWYLLGTEEYDEDSKLKCLQNALSFGPHEGAEKELRLHDAESRDPNDVFLEACAILKGNDKPFATNMFLIASKNGSFSALRELGKIYRSEGEPEETVEKCFKKAADGGDTEAAYELALIYQSRHDASFITLPWEENFGEKSREYLTKAADNNHPEAAYKLGMFYKSEIPWSFGDKNKNMAKHYLEIASRDGHASARNELNEFYEFKDERVRAAQPKFKNFLDDSL